MIYNFQAIQWDIFDTEENNENVNYPIKTCKVFCFGRDNNKKTHSIEINNFNPYFYIKLPKNITKNILLESIKTNKFYIYKNLNLEKTCEVKKQIFFGYSEEYIKCVKIYFKNTMCYYGCRKLFQEPYQVLDKKIQFTLYEDKVDLLIKFFHEYNFTSCPWLSYNEEDTEISDIIKGDFCRQIDIENLKLTSNNTIAPFLQMSYDIETFSNDLESFPVANNKEDLVIQIGVSFKFFGDDDVYKKRVLTLKKIPEKTPETNNNNDYYNIIECKNEKDLLMKFSKIIQKYNPDIIYSYNGYRFDDNYISERVKLNKLSLDFFNFSRYTEKPAKMTEKTFSSSAYGTSSWKFFDIGGRINFDVYIYINREYKLNSYKLDFVADNFLSNTLTDCIESIQDNKIILNKKITNIFKEMKIKIKDVLCEHDGGEIIDIEKKDNKTIIYTSLNFTDISKNDDVKLMSILITNYKNEMPYKNMFKFYKEGDPQKILDIANYCSKDTLLPIMLVDKLNILVNQIQMANVTYVPLIYLITRGQQIKVFSQILKEAQKLDYIIPEVPVDKINFEGATVLEPKKGAYFDPVIVLDFASLYPSIIMAHNLCYSTIIFNEKYLKNNNHETIEWEDKLTNSHKTYHFSQEKQGVLPLLLKNLLTERKKIKKLITSEKDEFQKMVYDGFQLALKVSANSIYGFLSANMLQCTEIGACVTAKGRQMIASTKNFINTSYPDYHTIYGDSVIGETPIITNCGVHLIKDLFEIEAKEFDNIRWYNYHEDKWAYDSNLYTWSSHNFTKIKRVIKHKTTKKIYKITTQKGIVFVTEDHSLLDANKNKIRPLDCVKNITKLYHNRF